MDHEPRIYLKDTDLKSISSILTHHLTPILFVSTYEIDTITWTDEKRRTLTLIDGPTTYFHCQHADEAVIWIVAAAGRFSLGCMIRAH
jgi:hypothetical protein